jgi:hypothetical protein
MTSVQAAGRAIRRSFSSWKKTPFLAPGLMLRDQFEGTAIPGMKGMSDTKESSSRVTWRRSRRPRRTGKSNAGISRSKRECIRPLTPLTLDDARRLIQIYVERYNTVRLHSAIGYVTPQDRLAGRQAEIHAARDRKLEWARSQRQLRRQQATSSRVARFCNAATMTSPSETEAGSAGTQPC